MAQVADTLNRMAAELQERISTITLQRKELETVLSSMAEGVFGVDRDECIIGMNPAAGEILGCDPVLSRGKTIQEAFRISSLQDFSRGRSPPKNRWRRMLLIHVYGERERALNVHGTPLARRKSKPHGHPGGPARCH